VKLDWALDAPIPWRHPDARRAGTLHIGEGLDALSAHASALARGTVPEHPFLLLGQYSMTDPSRQPDGSETAWAYTHVPQHLTWDERLAGDVTTRIESEIEALAPGFGDLIRARHVFTPPMFEQHDENLVGGAINGGTAQLHQQLLFRPVPRMLGRPATPVKGLYLASASAHPGGGVHGACGANAARAALSAFRLLAV
jgi:phytoene dehydrogenase-like protein